MQAWEQELMCESADILCTYGSEFFEVGLGLGISALRIASNPRTRRHVVIDKYQPVIDGFKQRYPTAAAGAGDRPGRLLRLRPHMAPASLDGIFFDPYLPASIGNDEALWNEVVPLMVRSLRPGGVVIPFFTTRPVLRWQFAPFFDRVVVERRSFTAYPTTDYTAARSGDAYIQCFVRTPEQVRPDHSAKTALRRSCWLRRFSRTVRLRPDVWRSVPSALHHSPGL